MTTTRITVTRPADATAEIQAALDAARPGDRLILPAGRYVVRAAEGGLALAAPRSGLVVEGEGMGRTVIELAQTPRAARRPRAQALTLRDLTIDGGGRAAL